MISKTYCMHTDGAKHNCMYVDYRNSLIPKAEAVANKACGLSGEDGEVVDDISAKRWNRVFHDTMSKLCRN